MLSYFKSQQPSTVFAFVVFFILIKLPFFFGGHAATLPPVGYLWGQTGLYMESPALLNIFLAQIALLLQAVYFNYLFDKANYHDSHTMIPALYYTLLSCLVPQFNQFSIYCLLGFILLFMFQTLLIITIKENPKTECFNLGFIGGVLLLLNAHFLLFLPFLFLMLFVIKPFRFNEYLMLLFGILCPVYLALGLSYLFDWYIQPGAFDPGNWKLFRFGQDIYTNILFILTGVYLLFSFVSLRGIMYSTGFKRRKNMNMMSFFFTGIVLTILFSGKLDVPVLSMLFIPLGIYMALFMLRIRKKRFGEMLNAIFVLTIFVLSVLRIFR